MFVLYLSDDNIVSVISAQEYQDFLDNGSDFEGLRSYDSVMAIPGSFDND